MLFHHLVGIDPDLYVALLRQEPSEGRTESVRLAGRYGYTRRDLEAPGSMGEMVKEG